MHSETTENDRSNRGRATRPPTRTALVVFCALISIGVVACSNSPTESGSSASCAQVFYELSNGHIYREVPRGIDFEVAGPVDTFTYSPCDDTNPGRGNTLSAADRTINIYRVVGLDPTVGTAIHSGDGPNGYRLLGRSTRDDPAFAPEFDAFVAAHQTDAATTTR